MGTEYISTALLAAGLRSFFRLAEEWCLTEAEQLILIGSTSTSELSNWRQGEIGSATSGTLERISYLLGIYKAIHTLLPNPAQANAWIRASNAAPLFDGASALDLMLNGRLTNLHAVRAFLDGQLG